MTHLGTVIVKDQSRLGRDHLETDRLMELIFPAYDVRFIAITDGVDSANGFNEMSGITRLTPELLRTFIKRIEVFEKEQKYSRTCGNKIVIQFNLNEDQSEKCDGILENGAEKPFAS